MARAGRQMRQDLHEEVLGETIELREHLKACGTKLAQECVSGRGNDLGNAVSD